jgi:uncharacterized protein YbaR (Trm112 family)
MVGQLLRLVGRITLAGIIIGAITAILGVAAIAVSELLSQRQQEEPEDELGNFSAGADEAPQDLDEEFLSLLACPVCKTSVRRENDRLICSTCGRRYPIRDGIPVMLIDEAELPAAGARPAE